MGHTELKLHRPTVREALQPQHIRGVAIQNVRGDGVRVEDGIRGVAAQVAFERQTLKPVFHLIG